MRALSRFLRSRRRRAAQHERLTHRWETLPEAARTPTQLAGVGGVACGATHGVLERCNLACTSCYLTDLANRTRALPFDEVRGQLEVLREHLGPGGKVQITSGEVTLLAAEELGRIVRTAIGLGLDPMVMTNGVRMLEEPGYLLALVARHGLRKVSFHVDATQRGRDGWRPGIPEHELHPIRDRLAELVRRVRRETGARLHAAHTVTVTPENLEGVPDVVAWGIENSDAVRILSFQPAADVGRTEDDPLRGVSADVLWERICRPFGRELGREALRFGHPDCNVTVPLLVARAGGRTHAFELARPGSASDTRAVSDALRAFGGRLDLDRSARANALPALFALARRPDLGASVALRAAARVIGERRILGALLAGAVRQRRIGLHPLLLVVHRFMDAAELETPLGRERLEACVLRVPVDGRLVSMCEVNATGTRRQLNARQLRDRARSYSEPSA